MAPTSSNPEPIAIVGSACRFPGPASNTSKLWEFLEAPYDISSEIPANRFNVDGFYHPDGNHHGTSNTRKSYFMQEDHRLFDAGFFQIHPREAETMDPQQRLLLETVYEALESAGFTMERMQGSQTSVFVGGMSYDFRDSMAIRDPASIPEYSATGTHASILAARISYFFDWKGPCMSIDTACSSSLVAVHQAVQTLRNGDATVAVAAGSNLIIGPEQYIALSNLHMLSPTGSIKMWDSSADGYARGEGFGVVMLKTLSQALKDGDKIECLIRETGVGQDGKTTGITMPNASAQTSLIWRTYERAGLDLRKREDRPQYFEAHGTGTPAGDPIEAEAIHTAFFGDKGLRNSSNDDTPLYVGSVKTAIGHLEGAAGIAGLLKASLAVQNAVIPPNLHFHNLNPKINRYYGKVQIPTSRKLWPSLESCIPRRASVNSFGFGGTNAHVILESYDAEAAVAAPLPPKSPIMISPLTVSAKTERSLIARVQSLYDYIAKHREISLEDLAWTLQSRRTSFQFRVTFSGTSRENVLLSMADALKASRNTPLGFRSQATQSRILGVFTGQGAQYATMGKEILQSSIAAQEIIARLEISLATLPDPPTWSIKEQLLADAPTSRLGEAALSQPLCTAVQIVLVDILYSAGVRFDAVVGHSSGEIGAAYAAGYLSASDAIRIAFYRGLHAKLAASSNGSSGKMMAVGLSFESAALFCSQPEFIGRASVAASNAPSSSTISGDSDAIDAAKEVLDEQKTFARKLVVDTAYHSHHMKPCAEPYLNSLRQCGIKILPDSGNRCKWFSSVYESGEHKNLDGTYWVDNMTRPVLFSQALSGAMSSYGPFDNALEIGPHPALRGPATETLSTAISDGESTSCSYHGTLDRKKDSSEALSSTLGFLWEHQWSVDFEAYRKAWHGPSYTTPVLAKGLPSYSWDHQQILYRESRVSKKYLSQSVPPNDLLGTREPNDSNHEMRWRNVLSFKEIPWLKDHRIQRQAVVPAMWYAAMVIEAARATCSTDEVEYIEIQDFEIIKATTLDENSSVETIFSLRKSSQVHDRIMNADFSCSMGSLMGSSSLDLTFQGKLSVQLGDARTEAESAPRITPAMDCVDVNQFYEHLQATGLEYSGPFRALESIRKKCHTSTTTASRGQSKYLSDPAMLDLGLQSLLAAFLSPTDGYASPLLIPRNIRRMVFNAQTCLRNMLSESKITFHSVVTEHSHSGMRGDIDLVDAEGDLEVQFEDVSWIPLSAMKPSSDRKLFAKTVWESDVSKSLPITVPEYSAQEQHLVAACDRAAWYYYRALKMSITPEEWAVAEWHHQRLFAYINELLPKFSSGQIPTVNPVWERDTHEDILSLVNIYSECADLQLIHAVGENLPVSVRERRTMLEFMMEDGKLNQYYQSGIGYQKCYSIFGKMVSQIAHRYPRMKVLEVGAGTGGATQHALNSLNDNFISYTFTDVSSGFFEKAQERFQDNALKMIFKTFDLERDPVAQGYQPHLYDLIVGSLVIHATKSLDTTLSYIRSLLKPGGYLILVEGSVDTLRSGFMMSGLPGWWVGGDDRKWGPMVSPNGWDKLLRNAGFSGIDAISRDSNLSHTNLGEVFVSQAVDDTVNLVRSPLDHFQNNLAVDHITILGGDSVETLPLVLDISMLLGTCAKRQTSIRSIEALQPSDVPSGAPVLCLAELDNPVFKTLTQQSLQGLQRIFSQAERILFVTRNDDKDHPYSHILLGLLRSLRLEIPHLKIQVLGIKGNSLDARVIVETFLRLIHMPSSPTENVLLWSLEPELEWGDGVLLIPRIIPDISPNNRLNSRRRLITTATNPNSTAIEIKCDGSSYTLQSSKVTPGAENDKIIVCHSSLQPVHLGASNYFVGLGRSEKFEKQILVLSTSNSSIISSVKDLIFDVDVEHGREAAFLYSFWGCLVVQSLLSTVPPGGSLLVHDADPVIRQLFSDEVGKTEDRVVYFSASSRIVTGTEPTIYLYPRATRRQLKQKLKGLDVTLFVDFSQQDMTFAVKACFPEMNCTAPFLTNASVKYSLETTSVDTPKAVMQALSSMNTYAVSESYSLPENIIITGENIAGLNVHDRGMRIIDWTQPSTLPVQVREIMDSFTLFSGKKTYLLVGLTGTMGKSLCGWMVEHGARYIVLTSRNPHVEPSWLARMSSMGAKVEVYALDICDRKTLHAFYGRLSNGLPPVAGVVNGAMVLRDGSFLDMSFDEMSECLVPKVDGSQYLDEIFRDSPLDFFIMFSSIAWVIGNPGQSNYSAANGYMNGLAAARRKRGLAASTMSIGVVAGVGYLARTKGGHEHEHAKRRNVMTISEDELHTIFAEAIVAGLPYSGHDPELIAGLDGVIDTSVTPRESLSAWLSDPRVSQLVVDKNDEMLQQNVFLKAEVVPLKQQLTASTNHDESLNLLTKSFSTKLERMLLLEPGSIINTSPLIDMGVDSLLAVEIRSWFVTELKTDVPILKILGGATVAELSIEVLAKFETALKGVEPNIETNTDEPVLPEEDSASSNGAIDTPNTEYDTSKSHRKELMSYAQARMWRVNQHTAAARVNNLSWAYRIDGSVDVPRFKRAFDSVVQMFESLRTKFFDDEETGRPTQDVMLSSPVQLEVKTVSCEEEIDSEFDRVNNFQYNLPAGNTMNASFLSLSDDAHVFISGFHHIVLDTRSIEIFLADLSQAYSGIPVKPALEQLVEHSSFEQHALSTGTWDESLTFWKTHHAGHPSILPLFPFSLIHHRQPMPDYVLNCTRHDLSSPAAASIKRFCSNLKISPYHLHTAVFQVLLHRLLHETDLCIGSVDANRTEYAYRDTFGPFFNYLPIRFLVSPASTFSELALSTRKTCYATAGHAQLPFDVILDSLKIERMPATNHPLYQAQMNYLRHTIEEVPLGNEGLIMRERNASGVEVSYDFCVSVLETRGGDGARILFHAQEYLYGMKELEWLASTYMRLLEELLENPDIVVGSVDLGEVPQRG